MGSQISQTDQPLIFEEEEQPDATAQTYQPNTSEEKQFLHQFCVIGGTAVGKTSLAARWTKNMYYGTQKSTCGVDCSTKIIGKRYLQVWDISGQELYGTMTSVYYREKAFALVTFDVTRELSLGIAKKYVENWKCNAFTTYDDQDTNPPILLVGIKSDLIENPRQIPLEDIYKVVREHEMVGYVEVSCKTGSGFDELEKKILEISKYVEEKTIKPINANTKTEIVNIDKFIDTRKNTYSNYFAIIRYDNNFKNIVQVRPTSRGLELNYPKLGWFESWKKKKLITIHSDIICKMYENELLFIIEDNIDIYELYLITKSNMQSFQKDFELNYPNCEPRKLNYKNSSDNVIRNYKIYCNLLKVFPNKNVILTLETISDNISYIDLGMIYYQSNYLQRLGLFRSIIWIHSLQDISLSGSDINDQDIKEICDCLLYINHVKSLRLNRNEKITSEGCQYLSSIITNNAIENITMSGCNSIGAGSKILFRSCSNKSSHMKLLDISNCDLDDSFLEFIQETSPFKSSFTLNINMNNFTAKSMEEFSQRKAYFSQKNLSIDIIEQYSSETIMPLNKVFLNRYSVEKLLGKGGGGSVFLCLDMEENNKKVAVKICNTDLEESFNEAVIHVGAIHDCIVRVFNASIEYLNERRVVMIVMEYYEYGSLYSVFIDHYRKKEKPYSEAVLSKFLQSICSGLSFMKGKNIIHRDIKPGNILISNAETLECYIADFGLATKVSETKPYSSETGIGSMRYMAPEMRNDSGNITHKGDIFSLGCVMYELMSFDFNTVIGMGHKQYHHYSEASFKEKLRENINARGDFTSEFVSLILKMISYEMDERPDADEIISVLE